MFVKQLGEITFARGRHNRIIYFSLERTMWEYISLPEKFLLYNRGGITADNKNWCVLNAINLQQIHLIFILTRFFMNHNKNIINDYKIQDTFFQSSKPLMLIHADLTSIDPSGAKVSDIAMKYIFMHQNVLKNVVCKISTIRSRPPRVNTTRALILA